jgi:hypothetical protein
MRPPSRRFQALFAALPLLLVAAAPALAKPPAKTHTGAEASDTVTLLTELSPTAPGAMAPLSFALQADGGAPQPFTIAAGTVLVVTDIVVTLPRQPTPPGRYVAALCDTPCLFSRIPIQMDTAIDGFQKTITLSSGVIFKTLPQFNPLDDNLEDMAIQVYGYVAKDK